MEIQGYAVISLQADCKHAMFSPDNWRGKIVRVMEFNDNSKSVLAVNGEATGMAMFDYSDLALKFKCLDFGGVLLPSGLSEKDKLMESMKRHGRKGGYNSMIRKLVIANSLRLEEFNDNFLFEKQ